MSEQKPHQGVHFFGADHYTRGQRVPKTATSFVIVTSCFGKYVYFRACTRESPRDFAASPTDVRRGFATPLPETKTLDFAPRMASGRARTKGAARPLIQVQRRGIATPHIRRRSRGRQRQRLGAPVSHPTTMPSPHLRKDLSIGYLLLSSGHQQRGLFGAAILGSDVRLRILCFVHQFLEGGNVGESFEIRFVG